MASKVRNSRAFSVSAWGTTEDVETGVAFAHGVGVTQALGFVVNHFPRHGEDHDAPESISAPNAASAVIARDAGNALRNAA